jgi:ribulose-5-phosphate 4-epimerase/fuculose-1-phosphate aldolase
MTTILTRDPADLPRPSHLADTATGLPIPDDAPTTGVDDVRRHRKQRLAAALRIFGKYGYGEGISGHLSVRDPGDPDLFWVNPFGLSFKQVRVRDLICVDSSGQVVHGVHKVNPSAFAIHSQIHQIRPDAEAIAHGHTAYSRALAATGQLLEPIDQESAAFYHDQVFYSDYDGPSVALEQGRRMAEHLGSKRAMLLRHHGLITVAGSIEEAVHWFITYESCAQVQAIARSCGQLQPMSEQQAELARAGFGDPQLGRFSFRLLWDEILREQPDFLEET